MTSPPATLAHQPQPGCPQVRAALLTGCRAGGCPGGLPQRLPTGGFPAEDTPHQDMVLQPHQDTLLQPYADPSHNSCFPAPTFPQLVPTVEQHTLDTYQPRGLVPPEETGAVGQDLALAVGMPERGGKRLGNAWAARASGAVVLMLLLSPCRGHGTPTAPGTGHGAVPGRGSVLCACCQPCATATAAAGEHR